MVNNTKDTQTVGQFQTVLQSMGEAVLVLDSDMTITWANKSAREMLGLARESDTVKITDVLNIAPLNKLIAKAQEGHSATHEFNIFGPPKRRVIAHFTSHGITRGSVVVIHDVTELRRLERIRRDFVANISHELRTPISVIRANAETLLDGALEDPKHARSFLKSILSHTERLSSMLADLLDIARIEAGKYTLDLQKLRLNPIIEHILLSFQRTMIHKKMHIATDIQFEEVCADPTALEQILSNLLENAIKYTPHGGHVEIHASRSGIHTLIEVRDNGPGIPEKYRERVFERFYRIDKGRSRELGDTGLGLAIVKHLVTAMKGKVFVKPAEPHGAIFTVLLPSDGPSSRQSK